MRIARIYGALGVLLWASTLQASDFRFEGTVAYSNADADFSETDTTSLTAAFFLAPVATGDAPRAEAAFLSKQSSVLYAFAHSKTELEIPSFATVLDPGPVSPPAFGRPLVGLRPISGPIFLPGPLTDPPAPKVDRHALSYRHVHEASGWFAQVGASLRDGDANAFAGGDLDGNSYRVAIGRYLTPTTTLNAFVEQDEQKTKSSFGTFCDGSLACIGINSNSRTEVDVLSVGVAARHVGQVRNRYYAVGAFLQHDESDTEFSTVSTITDNPLNLPITTLPSLEFKSTNSDIWRAGIDASWYFTQDLSITAGYSFSETRGNQDHAYSIQGRWFITPRIELRLRVARTDLELTADNIDLVGLTLGGRI